MRFFLFLFILFSPFSFAANFMWSAPVTGSPSSYPYFDPSSACASRSSSGSVWTAGLKVTPTQWRCYINGANSSFNVYRTGDSCPSGATYNDLKGTCDVPSPDMGKECGARFASGIPRLTKSDGTCMTSDTDIEPASWCKWLGDNTSVRTKKVKGGLDLQGNAIPPATVQSGMCEMQVLSGAKCTVPPPNCSNGVCVQKSVSDCVVAIQYTGKVADTTKPAPGYVTSDSTSDCIDLTSCDPRDPGQNSEQKPCNYTLDGEGRKVCSSSQWTGKDGTVTCTSSGSVNGVMTCSDSLAKPQSNGISIGTKVTETANSDGSKDVTKVDTATQFQCVGSLTSGCTTSVTTNTTNVHYDSGGNATSQSGNCVGKGCATSTNPDANGDGFGDCVGTSCGDGQGQGSSGGATMPSLDAVDGYKDTALKFFNRVKASPLIAGIGTISVPSGGGCQVYTAANDYIGTVSTESFCQLFPSLLSPMRVLFLACWAWAAIRLFMTA